MLTAYPRIQRCQLTHHLISSAAFNSVSTTRPCCQTASCGGQVAVLASQSSLNQRPGWPEHFTRRKAIVLTRCLQQPARALFWPQPPVRLYPPTTSNQLTFTRHMMDSSIRRSSQAEQAKEQLQQQQEELLVQQPVLPQSDSSANQQQPPTATTTTSSNATNSALEQQEAAQQLDEPQDEQQEEEKEGEAQPADGKGKPKQPAKPRPTHFVSLRVSHSQEVVECIQQVQQQLVSACPDLQPCLLEPVTAHMTVMVLHMPTQEQEAVADTVLSSLPSVLQQQGLGQLEITLRGLSTFRSQVLYLDVAPGPALDQLQQFGQTVMSHFRSAGSEIVIEEPGRGFTPHVTVAKSRLLGGQHHRRKRGYNARRNTTKIPPESWAELAVVSAGRVLLGELQICSMQGRKAGEFYRVTHSIPLPPLAAGPPPQAAAQVQPPSSAAAAGAEAGGIGGGAPARERKKRPAADSPLSGARRRFKRLLDALVCRKRADMEGVDVDTKTSQEGS